MLTLNEKAIITLIRNGTNICLTESKMFYFRRTIPKR